MICHIPHCIISSGSMKAVSTWSSESYYSKLKRRTYSRNEFNISTCINWIYQESIMLSTVEAKNINEPIDTQIARANNDRDININKFLYKKCIYHEDHNTNPSVFSAQGRDVIEGIELNDEDIKNLLVTILTHGSNKIVALLLEENLFNTKSKNQIIQLLNNPNTLNTYKNRLNQLHINYYTKILVNNEIIFDRSDINSGVNRIDNSYIISYTSTGIPHLYKALLYVQVEEEFYILMCDYGPAKPSKTGLYFIIQGTSFEKVFKKITLVLPSNIIVADVHVDNSCDESNSNKKKPKRKRRISEEGLFVPSSSVITYTVFTPSETMKNHGYSPVQ
ncbi:hypothetical protein WA158_007386 [Blastocystis sp. Blastoise]